MIDHILTPKRPKAAATKGGADDYDDFELPEGIEPDPEMKDRFTDLAKKFGLSKAQAQALVDLYAEHAKSQHARAIETHKTQISGWQAKAKSDREIGGQKFDASVALAQKAVDRFGGDPLAHALVDTGAASHPEVLRCFCRIGKAMSEDGFVAPGAKRTKKSYGETFYPDLNH